MPPSNALPPGPKGTRIGGNLRQFGARRLDFFLDVARAHGDLASFRFGPKRVFLASHPDLIEQVLVTDAKHYVKHFGARMYKPVLGNGLVTSEGDFWLRQRRLSQPAFLKSRVLSYAPVMAELTDRMLAAWTPGKAVDIHFEFSSLTSVIALKTLFDLDDPGDRGRFTDTLRLAFDLMSDRFRTLLRLPYWFPTPANRRLKRAVAELHAVVDGFIAQGRARGGHGTDLLSRLVSAQDDDGTRMTPRQLRDEAMTLYLAGHETTALTLAHTMFLLSTHPEIERKLFAELDSVLGGKLPTAADVKALPYMERVIKESMRLFPPAWTTAREAEEAVEIGGHTIPKGAQLLISQWIVHRDPRWFPNPEGFDPDRWLAERAKELPRYAYFPFGGGPRVCIGNHFAMMEATLLLAIIVQRWQLELLPGERLELSPSVTLRQKGPGLRVRLAERASRRAQKSAARPTPSSASAGHPVVSG